MKTLGKALLIGVVTTLLISTSVLAAYDAAITITESGSNSYDMLPVSVTMSNSDLVDDYYITSTGLDTKVLQASTPLPHMLASDRTLFALPISADTQYQLTYSTGNTALDSFYVITGYNSYITVSDADDLEPSNNFIIDQKGWVDTSSGSDKNLVYKENAFKTYISASSSITSVIYEDTSSWESPTGHNDPDSQWSSESDAYDEDTESYATEASVGPLSWSSFLELTLTEAIDCTQVRFWYFIAPSSAKFDLDVYYDSGWQHVFEGAAARSQWVTKSLGGTYPVTKARGRIWNPSPGSSWAGELYEFDFWELSAAEDVTVTATGVSSDVHTVKTVVTGGGTDKLQIWVGDNDAAPTLRQEVDLAGASVPDFTYDWLLNQNDVMPYMEYYKHTVSSTLIAWYQPVTIVLGTDLPDRDVNASGTADSGTTTTLDDDALTQANDYWNDITVVVITTTDGEAPQGEAETVTDYVKGTTGTADSGSTIMLRDDALTEDDDYWNGIIVEIVTTTDSLAPQGETATITDFVAADDELQFDALTATVDAGDTYKLYSQLTFDALTAVVEVGDTYELRNDGAITWGSNPGGVAATIGALLPETVPVAEVTPDIESPSFVPETSDESWFVTGVEGEGFPFYGLFKGLLDTYKDLGGADISMPYFWKIVAGVLGLIFGTFILLTFRSFLWGAAGYTIGFIVPATMGVLDWWMIIVYLMGAIPLCILITKWKAV